MDLRTPGHQSAADGDGGRDSLTDRIIGAALEVHRHLGPGLLESVYEECLAWELARCELRLVRQLQLPISYKSLRLRQGYRLDIVVEEKVIIELKALDRVLPVHEAQLLTYLKLSRYRTGLLFNFGLPLLRDGIKRMVL